MKKTRIIAVIMAAAMCLGLTACGGSSSSAAPAPSGDSSAPAASSETIKIGLMGPLTGDVAMYGNAVINGANLYIKQVNEAGGINGKQIVVNQQDEKGDATEAVNAYNLMVEDGIVALIGDVTSTPCIAVAQLSAQDNIPQVTASATAPDVVAYGNNIFQTTGADPEQGRVMAKYAKEEMKVTTVGTIFNSGDDYSTGCNDAFVANCEAQGVTVTSQQGYAAGDADFKAQLTTLMSEGVEAIYAPNYYNDIGKIVTQARQLGFEGAFIGVDGWSSVEEYASAEDLVNCYYCCSFSTGIDDPAIQAFVEAYTAEYGEAPGNFCALGYDAAMQMCEAIAAVEAAGVAYGTDEYKQAIIDALASQTVSGVTGSIAYEGTGTPLKGQRILNFVDGAPTYVCDFQ